MAGCNIVLIFRYYAQANTVSPIGTVVPLIYCLLTSSLLECSQNRVSILFCLIKC